MALDSSRIVKVTCNYGDEIVKTAKIREHLICQYLNEIATESDWKYLKAITLSFLES